MSEVAAIVDEEWEGVTPLPSSGGPVDRVVWIPPCFSYGYYRAGFWQVDINGRAWGVRPSDKAKQLLLDKAAFNRNNDPGDEDGY